MEHNLQYGYASYWNASIVTVRTHGHSSIRSVISVDGKLIMLDYWLANKTWFRQNLLFWLLIIMTRELSHS